MSKNEKSKSKKTTSTATKKVGNKKSEKTFISQINHIQGVAQSLTNSNAKRFIKAYNQIDAALRVQGDMRRSISYTEAVRRAARTNSLVAKYEDDLIDFGRLRNAIVHSSNDEITIAEPHDEVVFEYERIASLICTPPLAINTICNKVSSSIEYNTKLKDVIESNF